MLKAQKWDAVRMTRSAESFYTSIGFRAAAEDASGSARC